jgi:hypothetical protein
MLSKWAIGALVIVAFVGFSRAQGIQPSSVLIVYNSNYTLDADGDGVQDSLEVANYYAGQRGVPSFNILGVACSRSDYVPTYTELQTNIIQPIQAKLKALGPATIDVLLMAYGMPWIYRNDSLDNILMGLNYWSPTVDDISLSSNPYVSVAPTFVAEPGHFTHSITFDNTGMYLVARLDGPNGPQGAMNIVDSSLYAETYLTNMPGYFTGNIYVNSENRASSALYTDSFLSSNVYVVAGSYINDDGADLNIAYTEHYVIGSGFTLEWLEKGGVIGTPGTQFSNGTSAATAPNALFYGGWYNFNRYLLDVWDWIPGSIGDDFDSDELGYDIRDPHSIAWGTSALAYGVDGTCGAVSEPYTSFAEMPNVLLYYLLNGYSFAEAGALGNPAIGWKTMCIGDPLYTPLASKTAIYDTQAPQIASGYPALQQGNATGNVITVLTGMLALPEVVQAEMNYGTTASYGLVLNSNNWGRHHQFAPINLSGGTTYHYQITLTDPAGLSVSSPDMTFTTSPETPYNSAPLAIPGDVPAWQFDNGGEGVAYHNRPENIAPRQPRNDTGIQIQTAVPYAVVSAHPSEYLNYTVNVTAAGTYSMDANVCCGNPGGTFRVLIDGSDVTGTLAITNDKTYTTQTVAGIELSLGQHVMTLSFDCMGKQKDMGTDGNITDIRFY